MSATPLRVMVIADEDAFLVVQRLLLAAGEHEYAVDRAADPAIGRAALAGARHDVYLVGDRVGGDDGIALMRDALGGGLCVPVIIVARAPDRARDIAAIRAGALDFLVLAELDAERLSRAIRHGIDRCREQTALRASELAYRVLFERVPMPIWIYGLDDKRILAVNDSAVDHYGYSREEFLRMSIDMLRTPEEREEFNDFDIDRHSGLLSAGLWRHARKDGSVIEVEITSHSLDWDGRPARMVLAKDVTAQLRAQREVREREMQLRQILADASDGLLVIGADGIVRFANPALDPMIGRSPEQLEDRPVPRELDVVADNAEIRLDGPEPKILDVKVGNTVWDGEDARILALRDVTESRHTSERLRVLERAIQSTVNGIVITDARQPDIPIIFVNRAFEAVTGYARADVLGRNCRFLQGEDRDQAELVQVRDALRGQRECEVVVRNYRRDGTLFWNHLSIAPVRDEREEVTHFVGVINDLTDRRRYEAELAYMASHDPVTGLPRFAVLEEYLKGELPDAQASGARVAVFHIDLDRFHTVNETMGHTVGDQALRMLGERLRSHIGEAGRVARVAGDEFLGVLTYRRGEVEPMEFGEQLRKRVETPLEILPYKVYLTCSIGLAVFPDNATDARELLHCADAAVTRVKATGRNSVMAFSNDQADALRDRLALGGRLRAAILDNEMVLHYQPQVSAHNGRVVGLEALVRWQTPDLGLLPPARFIRVAEELGLIVDLGRWVLECACRQAKRWHDAGHDDFIIAVNVSALQFQRPSFLHEVADALRESGLPPRMLELELTESAIMENVERMVETMAELKRLGVRLALDDFGIGYSSLNYLKRFPIDKLKIDQSFVFDVTRDRGDAAIARSIIAIGHQLGMQVLAEGVETQAQLGYLRRNHCDEFQGMFFGMPVPSDEAEHILRRRYLSADAFAATRPGQTLLLLDDEENILRALVRLLRRDGYHILVATNAVQAFDI
ncbi:MAG TPA: EAL domain-containing protein, partial [Xanthomonadales bacterium]|nr:EAL domain-containing protein [Xanthomonadales bacterium]